ncbi:MAG: phosphatase PAP2 family protein [Saprospiraceae bacterium]
MQDILQWDIILFEAINHGWSNALFDWLLPWWRTPIFWLPLYVFLIAFLFFNYGRKGYWILLFTLLTVMTSDMTSSHLIKKNVQRLRPCNDAYMEVIERVRCGSGYSFTSSHATNHFALATFWVMTLGIEIPKIRKWLWMWATTIALAQVYVGVHYPLDILMGGILGCCIGGIYAFLFIKYYPDIFTHPNDIEIA